MEKAYKNLGYFFLLFIPLTFLGFYKTYFSQFPTFGENITTSIHLHALIASIWVLMLIGQPILLKYKQYEWHKRIGKFSYLVFPLLILSFLPMMIKIFHSDHRTFLFFPVTDSIMLTLFYGLAIYFRENVAKHMRYMIGTALVFIGPTVGRIGPMLLEWSEDFTQNFLYGLIYFILLGLIFLDRKKGKTYLPYLWILGVWVIHQIIFNLVF